MSSVEEIEKDLFELSQIRAKCQRPNVQKILDKHLSDYCDLLKTATKEAEKQKASTAAAPLPANPSALRPITKLTTYAYDESDKFMKLYVTIKGVGAVNPDQILVEFSQNSVSMFCKDVQGRDYELKIMDLAGMIVPEKSLFKQKPDSILLMMKKEKEGPWKAVIKSAANKKEMKMPDLDDKADPQDSLMKMMQEMYQSGDDEMKRTIRKSFYESQKKGAGGLPDLPM